MNKFIIAALLVALVTCGIKQSPAKLSDTKTVLAEMDKDAFGSTIISAVALNAAGGNPVEEITLLLEEIVQQLNEEQTAADSKNATDQAECDSTITALEETIAQLEATIESTENTIVLTEDWLKDARIALAQANADYDETVEAILTGTEQRDNEHKRWVEEDYQNQVSIATLEEGVKLINHMIHGVAFTQIKSRYDKVLEQLRDDTNKNANLFKPLISSLTQLATKLNYENVMKILDLLNNIRASIVEERESSRIAEEKAQADWAKLLAHLTSEKQRLEDKRRQLESGIEANEKKLASAKQSLENNKVDLENSQQTLENTVQGCNAASNTYITESEERARELEILERLLDHIREKYAQVTEYISNRESSYQF